MLSGEGSVGNPFLYVNEIFTMIKQAIYYSVNYICEAVIPVKAGIQDGTGCPRIRPVLAEAGIRGRLIKSGMTIFIFKPVQYYKTFIITRNYKCEKTKLTHFYGVFERIFGKTPMF